MGESIAANYLVPSRSDPGLNAVIGHGALH